MALTEGGGRSLDVVVGTPGLVCDMAARGVLKLDDIRVLMLDDADELLERGFEGVLDNLFKFIRPPNSSLNPNPATPPDSALGPTPVQVSMVKANPYLMPFYGWVFGSFTLFPGAAA